MLRVALLLPFFAQGAAMLVDEFYFHKRRGLPLWERLGHPLDTLTVLACFAWVLFSMVSSWATAVYAGLAAFSCLFVTKDEFVHSRQCRPAEQWLHAVLFTLHPACFFSAWKMRRLGGFEGVLKAQLAILCLFLVYQVVYWNLIWKKRTPLK